MSSESKKYIEIRDHATFIPAMAVAFDGSESWLAWRAGYSRERRSVILINLNSGHSKNDPYEWNSRTMTPVHEHLILHWDNVPNNSLLDARVLLGESDMPCASERNL